MKIWLKIALNAVRLQKFEPVIVVAEKDHGKRFRATFRAGVILRMRRNAHLMNFRTDGIAVANTALAMLALQAL